MLGGVVEVVRRHEVLMSALGVTLRGISRGVSSDCTGLSSSDIECSCSARKCRSREQEAVSEGGRCLPGESGHYVGVWR